jgi:hypothetical protein
MLPEAPVTGGGDRPLAALSGRWPVAEGQRGWWLPVMEMCPGGMWLAEAPAVPGCDQGRPECPLMVLAYVLD